MQGVRAANDSGKSGMVKKELKPGEKMASGSEPADEYVQKFYDWIERGGDDIWKRVEPHKMY